MSVISSTLQKFDIPKVNIDRVRVFSENVLNETYNRFNKAEKIRFERIFIGKVGEVIFSDYLTKLHIDHDTSQMFAIYPGTTNVDIFDFIIPNTGETIDVKTAYRDFHRRILIPYGPNGQWEQLPKNYYVGVKVHRITNNDGSIDIFGKLSPYAVIHGYIPRNSNLWAGPTDFGEGPCMWAYLSRLRPINEIIERMR